MSYFEFQGGMDGLKIEFQGGQNSQNFELQGGAVLSKTELQGGSLIKNEIFVPERGMRLVLGRNSCNGERYRKEYVKNC